MFIFFKSKWKFLSRIPRCVEIEKIPSDSPNLISELLAIRGVIKFYGMWTKLATEAIKTGCIQDVITLPKILISMNIGELNFQEMNEVINLHEYQTGLVGNDIFIKVH